jgi:hypothetical protein
VSEARYGMHGFARQFDGGRRVSVKATLGSLVAANMLIQDSSQSSRDVKVVFRHRLTGR